MEEKTLSLELEEEEWEEQEQEEELVVDRANVKGRYLTFWLEGQLYGMTIADTEQIVGVGEITPVPGYPAYAKGIINLRGYNIPVVDVRLRFGKPEAEYNERTCAIINKFETGCVGFIVDRVDEVAYIPDEAILPPPDREGQSYLLGLGKYAGTTVLLVDPQKLFTPWDARIFGKMGW